MEETKDNKRIITNEEFLQYKKQIESRDTDLEQFIFIIFRERYGLSVLEIDRLLQGDFEEEMQAMEEEMRQIAEENGIEYNSQLDKLDIEINEDFEKENLADLPDYEDVLSYYEMTEKEFLSQLSENKKEIFKQISEKFPKELPNGIDVSKIEVEKIFALAENDINKLNEVYENEENEICEILSNSDLSQIEPESFFECDFLEKINLEGSGAKLDMQKFNYRSRVKGSIKGCELISYNSNQYGEYDDFIKPESLDKSQYITVIEDILLRKGNIDYRGEEDFLFESQEIQDQIQWIYDKFLKNDKNAWACQKVFDLMTPETKAKNKEYVEKILEYRISEKEKYGLELIVEHVDKELFDKHFKDILQIYIDNQNQDFDKLIDLWSKCSSEIQIDKYEEFHKIISEKAGEAREYYLNYLLRYSKEEVQELLLEPLIEECRDDRNNLVLGKVRNILENTKQNVNLPQKYFEEILTLYKENKNPYNRYDFYNIWENIGIDTQKNNLISMLGNVSEYEFRQFWEYTNVEAQKDLYENVVSSIEGRNSELEHYFKGEAYIQMLRKMPEEDYKEALSNNIPKFINALKEKYNVKDEENTEDYSQIYDFEMSNILMDLEKNSNLNEENIKTVLENFPKFGKEIVYRVINSNSKVIQKEANNILLTLAIDIESAEQKLGEIENIFAQSNLPDFIKLYKYFELVQNDNKIDFNNNILSPSFLNTKSKSFSKRIIFSDLMKISMDSNNKSMKDFVATLEQGNELYKKVMKNDLDVDTFNKEEKLTAQKFIKTIYSLYEISNFGEIDKRNGRKIGLTGDIKEDFETIGKKYSRDGLIEDLPDRVLRTIVGPTQELFGGIDTVEKIKQYMNEKLEISNERHKKLAEEKIDLKTGDLIKGVQDGIRVFPSIVSNGVRAGEFLGIDSHSDSTPLDTDFSVILDNNNGYGFLEKLKNTVSNSYGNMFVVIKYNPTKMEYTRKNSDLTIEQQGLTINDKISRRDETEIIRKRVKDKTKGEYDSKKLEIFSSSYMRYSLWNKNRSRNK